MQKVLTGKLDLFIKSIVREEYEARSILCGYDVVIARGSARQLSHLQIVGGGRKDPG